MQNKVLILAMLAAAACAESTSPLPFVQNPAVLQSTECTSKADCADLQSLSDAITWCCSSYSGKSCGSEISFCADASSPSVTTNGCSYYACSQASAMQFLGLILSFFLFSAYQF